MEIVRHVNFEGDFHVGLELGRGLEPNRKIALLLTGSDRNAHQAEQQNQHLHESHCIEPKALIRS